MKWYCCRRILQAAVYVYTARDRAVFKTACAVAVFASLNALLLLMVVSKVPITSAAYFWSSLLWFSWYLYGRSVAASRTGSNRAMNGASLRTTQVVLFGSCVRYASQVRTCGHCALKVDRNGLTEFAARRSSRAAEAIGCEGDGR